MTQIFFQNLVAFAYVFLPGTVRGLFFSRGSLCSLLITKSLVVSGVKLAAFFVLISEVFLLINISCINYLLIFLFVN